MQRADFSKTLEQLEGSVWEEPVEFPTSMVARCYRLRRKRLCDMPLDEVALAVRQKVGIPYVLELGVAHVRHNPGIEAEHYPGDLLAALLRVDQSDWDNLPELAEELSGIFERAMIISHKHQDEWTAFREVMNLPGLNASIN